MSFTVNVGNIGNIEADTLEEAKDLFEEYVGKSIRGEGRAAGENVALFSEDGELLNEHIGTNSEEDDDEEEQEESYDPRPHKFNPGGIMMTKGVSDTFGIHDLFNCLRRHVRGDWGCVDAEDQEANDASLLDGTRLLSVYMIGGAKLWIITEADRSLTTLLLPDEY